MGVNYITQNQIESIHVLNREKQWSPILPQVQIALHMAHIAVALAFSPRNIQWTHMSQHVYVFLFPFLHPWPYPIAYNTADVQCTTCKTHPRSDARQDLGHDLRRHRRTTVILGPQNAAAQAELGEAVPHLSSGRLAATTIAVTEEELQQRSDHLSQHIHRRPIVEAGGAVGVAPQHGDIPSEEDRR